MKELTTDLLREVISLEKSTFSFPDTPVAPMDIVIGSLPNYFTEEECNILLKLSQCQGMIVYQTKSGLLAEGEVYLAAAKYLLRQLQGEAKTMGKIFVYPAFSLHAYKEGKHYLAKRFITQLIGMDDLLCSKFPILHLHKLHHLANKINAHLRDGQTAAAAKIMTAILVYLRSGCLSAVYGKGNTQFLDELFAKVDESNVVLSFYNQFFQPMIAHPELAEKVLRQKEISALLTSKKNLRHHCVEPTAAVISFLDIKNDLSFSIIKPKKILEFFTKYNSYNFDILKLILLRNIHHISKDNLISKLVNQAIGEHLNFKFSAQLFVSENNTEYQNG